MESFVLTLVAISLPLTSLWATSLTTNRSEPGSGFSGRYRLWKRLSNGSSEKKGQSPATESSASGALNMTSAVSSSTTAAQMDSLYPDLEAGTEIGVNNDVTIAASKV